MSTPRHSGDHHGDHPAPETDHTHHPDHASHEHHADADTHGQAMPHGHPHSALDEDHHVHGHGEHAGHSTAMFRERFWWSLILSIPVVIFSPMVAHLLGYPLPEFPGSTWIPPVLSTIIFVYGGTPFLKGGWKELKSRQPGMMLLIAMAITVAFVASWVTTLGLGGFELDFWWELALLVTIMLLGHWLEMRALGGASSALDALAALLPDEAEKVIDGTTRTVATSELVVGDVVLVRAGARVPADGTILDGAAEFDEAMITGESRPVFRDTGDKVVAGTVATDNTVRVRVEATGGDTALAGIQRMVADAQESSSRAQALADRAAALLFWFALISALITAVVWTIIGSPDDAVVRTVTVLVIACPHALGLAIPLVIAISTERAAKSGVLIKDRMALERMRTIDVVLFDKTGTLTEGAHTVTGVAAAVGVTEGELLALAAAEAVHGGRRLPARIVEDGFASVTSPGRLEVLRSSPTVLVDAGHNPHGIEALTGAIEEAFGFQHLVAVLGVMADKDAEGILAGLEPVTDAVVCVPIDSPRAMDVEDLGEIAREVYGADRVVVSQQLGEGVERAVALSEGYDAPLTASGILIVGSVVLAAEARALFGRP